MHRTSSITSVPGLSVIAPLFAPGDGAEHRRSVELSALVPDPKGGGAPLEPGGGGGAPLPSSHHAPPPPHSSSSSSSSLNTATRKKVSVFAVALLCFSCVAGGPFGIEAAVQAAGALPTVVGLVVAGLLWGCPQALLTAELASAIPANGGPIVWVRRAWGDQVAFVNGLLLVFNQVTDICLYPTLVASYVQMLFPDQVSDGAAYGIKLAALAVTVALNVVGVEALSASAAILTGIILAPFVVLPIVAAAEGLPFAWSALGPSGVAPDIRDNLALFASTILWNMQGWSELGCLAGEIESAETVFPRGMLLAACLVVLAYACPVLFGVALFPDLTLWGDGFLVSLAQSVAPWLAGFVLLSAALANMSTFLTSMAAYSRTLQAAAREGIVPVPLLAKNFTRFRTPVPSILLLMVSTACLGVFDFGDLVIIDSSFYMVANMCVISAFLRLRYTEPDLPRPYRFPGGHAGAWAGVVSTEVLALFSIWAVADGASWAAGTVLGTVAVLFALSFPWAKRCRPRFVEMFGDDDGTDPEDMGEGEEDAGDRDDDGGGGGGPGGGGGGAGETAALLMRRSSSGAGGNEGEWAGEYAAPGGWGAGAATPSASAAAGSSEVALPAPKAAGKPGTKGREEDRSDRRKMTASGGGGLKEPLLAFGGGGGGGGGEDPLLPPPLSAAPHG
jgi:amino acid transporter